MSKEANEPNSKAAHMNSPSNGDEQAADTFIQDCLSALSGKQIDSTIDNTNAKLRPAASGLTKTEPTPLSLVTDGTEPLEQLSQPETNVNEKHAQIQNEEIGLSEQISLPTSPPAPLSVSSAAASIAATPPTPQLPPTKRRRSEIADMHPVHLATSTFLSLVMVLALLLVARLLVPSLVESIRYGWYRGQLRAEYEVSGERLQSVSLDSLADVSQLVSQRAGPSVVHINLLSDRKTLDPIYKYQGQGSGFVVDSSGYILTNQHVVDDVGAIEVTLSDGRRLPAELIGSDPLTDLAVLKVSATGLMAVDWGDSHTVVVGTPVWAIGSPFGLQQTVTFGIISGKHRVDFTGSLETRSVQGTPYSDLMQSDVALNPGNSGGPLVNSLGQVIGVNAAILGETFRGVSFSIPSRVAKQVAEQLIALGEVPRGWLGVQLKDPTDDDRFDKNGVPLAGVCVAGFPRGLPSPAQKAGLLIGDKIVSFEGEKVNSSADLMRMIGESTVGKTVSIEVERASKQLFFNIALERRATELSTTGVGR